MLRPIRRTLLPSIFRLSELRLPRPLSRWTLLALCLLALPARAASPAGTCVDDETTLCLANGRFQVEVTWQSPQSSGLGRVQKLTQTSGYFWFFAPDNVELVLKIVDACAAPFERFWVFAAGLTNVAVEITVTDTASGETWRHSSALGTPFLPVQDTQAFATCPTAAAVLGEPFELRVGQTATFLSDPSEALSLRFVSVVSDSRCPSQVFCVWAGDAEIEVELERGTERATVHLHTSGFEPWPSEVAALGHRIVLERLDPYPELPEPIPQQTYVATLRVD